MGFKCGIVGLPNVGKSTLFNAVIGAAKAEAANYPFCTIEPNTGTVAVPDERLDKLVKIVNPKSIINAHVEIVDIAGLVRGASSGEGLGNKFLSHIREVDLIISVVRCFDGDITHVEGNIDPIRDIELINTELVLADLESLSSRMINLKKRVKSGLEEDIELLAAAEHALPILEKGDTLRSAGLGDDPIIKKLQLITSKPLFFVCNVGDEEGADSNEYAKKVKEYATNLNIKTVVICAKVEEELVSLSDEERAEYMEMLNIKESGLDVIIKCSYSMLGLQTYFTAGPKEVRAWTIKKGSTAPEAAAVIHSDFQKGFIRAEVITYDNYIKYASVDAAKAAGKLGSEGKEYIVQDGDMILFRFNV